MFNSFDRDEAMAKYEAGMMRDANRGGSKSKGELNAIREAQKRLSWIENVKRVNNMSQEEAEAAWAKIFATIDRKDG